MSRKRLISEQEMSMRAALYLRVSTDGQTVENQRRELLAVAKRHGWEIGGEFIDHGISGAKGRDRRPGLDRLLKGVACQSARKRDPVSASNRDPGFGLARRRCAEPSA